jgi:hypothetical protein
VPFDDGISVICATQHYSVYGIGFISKTVIEGGRSMGMFAAEKGERCEPFSLWG